MNINNGKDVPFSLQKNHCGDCEFKNEEFRSAFVKVDNIMEDLKTIISQINIINKIKKKNNVS
jgi:hypothetical protein